MKVQYTVSLVVGLLGSLLAGTAAWAADATTIPTDGVHPREVVLDNGLTLLLLERHDQPTVAAGVFYNVGGVNDPRGKSGIAHLFEHMLFKGSRIIGTTDYEAERLIIEKQDKLRTGMIEEMNKMRLMKRQGKIEDVLDPAEWTKKYSLLKGLYDKLIEEEREYVKNNELFNLYTTNGGSGLNAGTMADLTMYFVQLPSNKLELFFWLESDRMAKGIMREFYVERFNVREERRLRVESTPTGKLNEAFEALFWQSHPYGVPVIGWPSEVESITRDDVRDFYKIYYAPNNARVVLVGDFDTDQVIETAKKYFERIPRGEKDPAPVLTEEPRPISVRRLNGTADTNPRVRVRYHTVAMGHSDEAVLDVLGGLMSGKTGRLYKRLATKEDAVIGTPSASSASRKYAGYFELRATVKEGVEPEDVERMLMEEIDSLRDGEITEHELQKVKNQVLASSVRRLRSSIGLMFQLGLYDTYTDWSYINESPKRMLAVTVKDIRRVLTKYFDHDTRTVAIYRTRVGAQDAPIDPELAAVLALLPEERHATFKASIENIKRLEDPFVLSSNSETMRSAIRAGLRGTRKVMIEYIVKTIDERLAELEAASKESN